MLLYVLIIIAIILIAVLVLCRPKAAIHQITLDNQSDWTGYMTLAVAVLTILVCILPMNLAPAWNGENPAYRNQYEVTARSFLEGHLYLDYGAIDERLLALENPYDPAARTASGVVYQWDHSFYNGHYYMYFGVVPVFLLFLPFRLITGGNLTTYHATQIFAALYIAGLFLLFGQLAKKFFQNLSYSIYLLLSVAFSFMSIWYATEAPALYCTAITAGLCMEVWSLYFFVRAVYNTENENKALRLAFFGSLFGALAFGCRPPIALANILVIPMLVTFLKGKKFTRKFVGRLIGAASPYVIIGALLMWYNYARFGNVLEFGQSYQLTIVDVSKKVELSFDTIKDGLINYFTSFSAGAKVIKYGALVTFPILFYPLIVLENDKARKVLKQKKLGLLVAGFIVTILLIALVDILGSPMFFERYRMDIYWIFGIFAYVMIGIYYQVKQNKRNFSFVICFWAVFTIAMSVRLFLCPNDANYTAHYFNDFSEFIQNFIS